jgi:hypothetical protein
MLALECTTITFFLYVSRAIERAPLLQGAARLGSALGVETGLCRIAPSAHGLRAAGATLNT